MRPRSYSYDQGRIATGGEFGYSGAVRSAAGQTILPPEPSSIPARDTEFVARRESVRRRLLRANTAVAVLKFKNGALGVIEGATSIAPGVSRRVEIHGEKGSVTLEGNDITAWNLTGTGEEEEALSRLKERDLSNGASDPMALDIGGHRRQMEDLIAAIREDRPPMIDGTEGLKALELVLAIYRSARNKTLVEL